MMGIGATIDLYTETPAVTIEDFMFDNSTTGELKPLASPQDYHDTWDLDGTDFTPEASPDDEGYWDDFENIVLNHDYEELGSEQANYSNNNISFNNASDSTTISLGSNSYRSEAFGNSNDARPRVNINGSGIVTGKTYEVTYTPTSFTGSTVFDFFQNSTRIISDQDASIAKTFYFVASDGYDGFDFDGSQTFRSDYTLSVKQVDPNDRWSLGTGWSIEDGVLTSDGTATNATQSISITAGSTYEVTFTISSYTSGAVRITLNNSGDSGSNTSDISSAGTYTAYLTVGTITSGNLIIDPRSNFVGSVDNVIVKEYAITPLDV